MGSLYQPSPFGGWPLAAEYSHIIVLLQKTQPFSNTVTKGDISNESGAPLQLKSIFDLLQFGYC
jgi:hypothetical protein